MNKSFLVLFVFLQSLPVYAMVYTWIDSAGVAHYTNKDYEVPSRYRAKAKSLYPEQGDTGVLQQNVPAIQPPSVTPQSATVQQSIPVTPPLRSVQQSKPEALSKAAPPVIIAPEPHKNPPVQPTGKASNRRRGPIE
jgi:hypothetical protein